MRKTFWLVAAIAVALLLSCSVQTPPTGTGRADAPDYSDWRWQAVSIRGLSSIAGPVTFEIDSTSTLLANGSTACNYYGSVIQMSAYGRIEFGPIFRTKIGCQSEIMRTEDAYLAALQDTHRYRIMFNRLEFFDDAGVQLVMFKRLTP